MLRAFVMHVGIKEYSFIDLYRSSVEGGGGGGGGDSASCLPPILYCLHLSYTCTRRVVVQL